MYGRFTVVPRLCHLNLVSLWTLYLEPYLVTSHHTSILPVSSLPSEVPPHFPFLQARSHFHATYCVCMKWRVLDQRGLGERLWKKTVKHPNWTGRMLWIIVDGIVFLPWCTYWDFIQYWTAVRKAVVSQWDIQVQWSGSTRLTKGSQSLPTNIIRVHNHYWGMGKTLLGGG